MHRLILLCLPLLLAAGEAAPATPSVATGGLPTLLDLGSVKCQMCKDMSAALAEVKARHPGKLTIVFIDVNAGEAGKKAAQDWKITGIPVLIFLDAQGKELYRHDGAMKADEIVAKWKELKVDLGAPVAAKPAEVAQPAEAAKPPQP